MSEIWSKSTMKVRNVASKKERLHFYHVVCKAGGNRAPLCLYGCERTLPHPPCTHVKTGEPGAVHAGSPPSVPQTEEETHAWLERSLSKACSFTQQYLWLSLPVFSALVWADGGSSLGVRSVTRFLLPLSVPYRCSSAACHVFLGCLPRAPRLPATCRRCAGVLCGALAALGLPPARLILGLTSTHHRVIGPPEQAGTGYGGLPELGANPVKWFSLLCRAIMAILWAECLSKLGHKSASRGKVRGDTGQGGENTSTNLNLYWEIFSNVLDTFLLDFGNLG